MIKQQFAKAYPGAYVLTDDDLRAFERSFTSVTKAGLRLTLELSSGETSYHNRVDELLVEPALHAAGVDRIVFESLEAEAIFGKIEFRSKAFTPIIVVLTGSKDPVLVLQRDLANLIEKPRVWYSWIKAPFKQVGIALAVVAILGLGGLVAMSFETGIQLSGGPPHTVRSALSAGALSVCLGWILLPSMQFAIGRGLKRWQRAQSIAAWVFLGVGTGVILNWSTDLVNPLATLLRHP